MGLNPACRACDALMGFWLWLAGPLDKAIKAWNLVLPKFEGVSRYGLLYTEGAAGAAHI